MNDRVVVVTGATGNLGQVVARRFAEDGARLALLARDEENCIGLAASLPGGMRRHRGVPVDLSDAQSAVAAADSIRKRLGPASVLLHLVGGYVGGTSFVDTTEDDWRDQIELNLLSTVHAVRAFLPDISAAEHGRVIAISTPVAGAPTPGHAPTRRRRRPSRRWSCPSAATSQGPRRPPTSCSSAPSATRSPTRPDRRSLPL